MNGPRSSSPPVQNTSNVVSQALAHNHFQGVAQRYEPALTAYRGHFSNMVDIYDCITVDSLELLVAQSFPNDPQILVGQKPLFGGNDPYQPPVCLKRQNVIRFEHKVLVSPTTHDLSTRDRATRQDRGSD